MRTGSATPTVAVVTLAYGILRAFSVFSQVAPSMSPYVIAGVVVAAWTRSPSAVLIVLSGPAPMPATSLGSALAIGSVVAVGGGSASVGGVGVSATVPHGSTAVAEGEAT